MRYGLLALWFAASLVAADSCVDCHLVLEGKLQAPAKAFANDIHAHFGFSCADCHGGDRNQTDPEAAMSKARGFVGKISRTSIPERCAHCHSDASLIEKYKPRQRVDQMAQYKTSVHGKRLAAGDVKVANCVDCHSVHDIREVRDPLSPVHPLRLPETCARCHADAAHMAGYKIPTDQFAAYRKSVHWEALAKRGDLSAPSCASCHGNHGAQPPQVESVAAVCGSCHVMMEDLYKASPHQPVFAAMGAGGCVVCHGNHEIRHPVAGMLAGPNAVCSQCHDATSAGGLAAAEMGRAITGLEQALERSDQILARAQESGMEVSEALLREHEARENLVKAAVAVHAFRTAAVQKPVGEGLAIAAQTYRAGVDALRERGVRRLGLAVSLVAIAMTILGLWLALRAIEGPARKTPETTGR
ncbi:MAG TPA: cytochrome c3 family protein [Terriglobales bacterium]|nr:cytochrome c3 family protein [Terriglobales bacterium]